MSEQSAAELLKYERLCSMNKDETTFVARNTDNGRIVVLKEITPNVKDIYTALAELKPQGVPVVFEVMDCRRGCFAAEELAGGISLTEYLRESSINAAFVRRCASEICRTLIPIHKRKIIHRDINPNNILVKPDGHFLLIDFGIARSVKPDAQRDTVIMGTQGYVAPEQYGFEQTKATADIYSLGVLIKELLNYCGHDDFVLREIANKCTQIKPEERYQSASALYTALGRKVSSGRPDFDKIAAAVPFARSENSARNKAVFCCVMAAMVIIGLIFYGQVKSAAMFWQMTAGLICTFIVPFITIGNWSRIAEYNSLLNLLPVKSARYVPLTIFVLLCVETGIGLIKTAFMMGSLQ